MLSSSQQYQLRPDLRWKLYLQEYRWECWRCPSPSVTSRTTRDPYLHRDQMWHLKEISSAFDGVCSFKNASTNSWASGCLKNYLYSLMCSTLTRPYFLFIWPSSFLELQGQARLGNEYASFVGSGSCHHPASEEMF